MDSDERFVAGALLVLFVVLVAFFFVLGGGLAFKVEYTVASESLDASPAPPVFSVKEVRKMGADRTIYKSLDIDDAIRVMREMEAK